MCSASGIASTSSPCTVIGRTAVEPSTVYCIAITPISNPCRHRRSLALEGVAKIIGLPLLHMPWIWNIDSITGRNVYSQMCDFLPSSPT
eukprot:2549643-Pleurochrysis_carterae.AAC.2